MALCREESNAVVPVPIRASGGEGVGSALLEEDEGTPELFASLQRAQTHLAAERMSAPQLCAELLAEERETHLARVSLDRRLHTWGVCEELLQRSQLEEERNGADAGHLAALVLAAADRLDPGLHSGPLVHDLRAKAWAAVGEARRRAGDRAGTEEALRSAAGCLAQGTGDLLVEARLLEFEAAVRQEQGRPGEALALLKQASSRYLEIHEFHLLTRTLVKRERLVREALAPELGLRSSA